MFAGRLAFLLSLGVIALSRNAAAADRPPGNTPATLPEIVVTASRTPIPFEEALADLTVIDGETIDKSGAASLADLLARQPGIEIARYGGTGAATSLFIRGTNSGHALVLVDGVRTAALSTGATSLETLPLAGIERIEILRGAASMLYGADALGGVVQIFTKKGGDRPLSLLVDGGCGSYSTCSGNVQASGRHGAFRWAAGAGAEKSRGFSAIDDPGNFSYNPDRDGYRNDHQRASLEFSPTADHVLTAAYLRDAMNAQIDTTPTDDDRTQTRFDQARLAGTHQLFSGWTMRWQLSDMTNDSRTLSGGDVYRYRSRERQYLWQNEIDTAALVGDVFKGTLLLALERDEQRLDGSTDYDRDSRDSNAAIAGYRWQRDAHALQLSARYDRSTQYGGETSGGVNYGYRLTPEWKLIAGIASAYKAPTFNDLYFPDYSNPDLSPEKGHTLEAGVRRTVRNEVASGEWRATIWDNRIRDMIVYACNDSGQCRPENIDRAHLRGLTLATDWRIGDYGAQASFDWQLPEDSASGKLLPRRARTHGSFTLSRTHGDLYAAINFVASGRRFDDAANTRPLAGYGVVNLVLEWTTPLVDDATLTWYARVDNLFDRDYRLVADFATGGIQAMAGVRGRW